MDHQLLYEKANEVLERIHLLIRRSVPADDSLLSGRLGLVLYYFTRFEAFEDQSDRQKGVHALETVFENLNKGNGALFNPSFSSGISGFLYVLNYLSERKLYDFDLLADYREYDQYLQTKSFELAEIEFNDYLHGLFGILFYFTSRLPDPDIEENIKEVLLKVFNHAEIGKDSFWIRNYLLEKEEKHEINFGLSHGQPAFLLILLKAFEMGIFPERNYDLITKGIRNLINYKQEIDYNNNMYSFFPLLINNKTNELKYSSRLSWCYGDLNELLLLYKTADIFDDDHYRRIGDIIGGSTVNRLDKNSTLCVDSHFCHGAAGVAQFYKTLYRLRGLPIYNAAYNQWIAKTIQFLEDDLKNDSYKNKEASLLEGLVGVGLTLTSFVSPKPLEWSQCLLL